MDVKQAVHLAKTYLADLYSDEGLSELRLEEVEHDDDREVWNITLGFFRPPTASDSPFAMAFNSRIYKVVQVRDDGRVISVKHREFTH